MNWLQAIPLVELAVNSAVNDSTKISPAYVGYAEYHLLTWDMQSLRLLVDCLDGMAHVEAA